MKTITIVDTIDSLRPKASWYMADGILVWEDETQAQPTEEEIQAEMSRLQAEADANEYAVLRKAEYDKLNQDEMRFDDLMNGTTTWQDAILAIKAKYPKP